ncbi:PREDICTED: protein TIFY 10B-like isoform X2 [Lupinus angustifolius]|uniref:protein TIFY 10B-like isoform X2 n=1 Tax=Lupinus angustifolius TaxID=3871 RepID=UPI00092F61B2|nr:PREDICTED: protein TIFY 10B-like isoform X2 [Lupinus angustifolius]
MKSLSLTPLNLFSQQVSDLPNMGNSSVIKSDPRSAQMTIFYGGEVIVFDDCSAEKAKEIVSFVNKGKSQIQNNNNFPYTFPFDMNVIPDNSNNLVQEHHTQAPSRPVSCGLPLTRKASLYRFLEKRKDRIAARTPYQTSNPTIAPYKPAESMSWLALSPHSPQDRSESCSNFV